MAQLVAHLLCKQGVTGSSPVGSTIFERDCPRGGLFLLYLALRCAFGLSSGLLVPNGDIYRDFAYRSSHSRSRTAPHIDSPGIVGVEYVVDITSGFCFYRCLCLLVPHAGVGSETASPSMWPTEEYETVHISSGKVMGNGPLKTEGSVRKSGEMPRCSPRRVPVHDTLSMQIGTCTRSGDLVNLWAIWPPNQRGLS